jgi:hypothetical protein
MINPKFTSIYEVIESVYINAGYQQINWNEALVYIQRIIGLLGISGFYTEKITNGISGQLEPIRIINYRGELPYDLISPIACREFVYKQPMIYSTDLYHKTQSTINLNSTSPSFMEWGEFQNITEADLIDQSIRAQYFNFKNIYEQEVYQGLSDRFSNIQKYNFQLTYKYNDGFILTNFEEGWVEMVYRAIPTDDNGFPMIPDDEKIKRAVEYYIIERLDYKMWRQNKLSKDVYFNSQKELAWAIASAKSHADIPSIDQMESWKNSWCRLNPKFNEHYTGFKTQSIQESLNIGKNTRGFYSTSRFKQ